MGVYAEACSAWTCRSGAGKFVDEKDTYKAFEAGLRRVADNFGRENVTAMIWAYIAAFVTGILASLGVGGGMVLIIYLTVFGGFDQLSAQGINLIYFLPIALLSVIIHSKNGLVEWKKILPSLVTGVIFALAGAALARYIGSPLLRKIFAGFILLIGVKELFGSFGKRDKSQE